MVESQHRNINDALIGVVLVLLVLVLQIWQPAWLGRLDGIAYDFKLLHFSKTRPASPVNIQIVDVDEVSLKTLGRWPWPRKYLGQLTENLVKQGAIVLVFDMLFSEPQTNPVEQVERHLKQVNLKFDFESIRSALDDDGLFAEQIEKSEVILGTLLQQNNELNQGEMYAPKLIQSDNDLPNDLHKFVGYNASIERLNAVAKGQGFINAILDPDGFLRRAALVSEYKGRLYPSLALEAFRVYSFAEKIQPNWQKHDDYNLLSGLTIGNQYIPTDNRAQLLVPYKGPVKSYPYSSASEVIENKIYDSRFEGAVVFIGTSSIGMVDLRATPVSLVFPGIEIHATVFDALTQPSIQPVQPDWWLGANVFLLIISGIILSLLLPRLSPRLMTLAALTIIAAVVVINITVWRLALIHLPIMTVFLLTTTLYVFSISVGFYRENRQRRHVKEIFDQYVPPAHIDKLLENPGHIHMRGERKNLTVLFADIRGFTQLSENMPANILTELLNSYFSPITELIFKNQGTIDKYVGDMVMAFWGAPLADTRHAEHTLDAAFEMLVETKRLSNLFVEKGWPKISIGIGINTGDMNVGDMGSTFRRSYTILGDAVNLGSRLESLTKYYGVTILVSETTKLAAPQYRYQAIDKVKVKGKQNAVVIYLPLSNQASEADWLKAQAFNFVFECYQQRAFMQGFNAVDVLGRKYGDCLLYQIYRQRLMACIEKPPSELWEGVYTHESK